MRVLHATSFGKAIWRIQNALHALFSGGIPIDIHWVQSRGLVRAALAVTAVADVTGRRNMRGQTAAPGPVLEEVTFQSHSVFDTLLSLALFYF